MGNMTGGNIGFGRTTRRDLMEIIDNRNTPSTKFIYTADKIAPPLKVNERYASINELLAGNGDRYVEGDRGQDGSYPLISWTMGEDSYKTKPRGWEMAIDEVEDTENNEIIDLQKEHARQLVDTARVYREKRIATAMETLTNYAATNKKEISLAANNWLTGDNMRDQIISEIEDSTIRTEHGLEIEDLSLVLPLAFLRNLVRIDEINDRIKYAGNVIDLMAIEQKANIVKEFCGVKDVIITSGRINTADFEADAPTFSRIWSASKAFLIYVSDGSKWNPGFARQPWWHKPLKGKRDFVETYSLPQYDQMRTRLKNFDGNYFNYSLGFCFSGIAATGT